MKLFKTKITQKDDGASSRRFDDVFVDRQRAVLSFDRKEVEERPPFWKRYLALLSFSPRWLIGVVIALVLVSGILVLLESTPGQAQIARYYAGNCLGSWQATDRAEGEPDVYVNEVYTSGKAASTRKAGEEIFCTDFTGRIPPESQPTRAVLKFTWQIGEGRRIDGDSEGRSLVEESADDVTTSEQATTTEQEQVATTTGEIQNPATSTQESATSTSLETETSTTTDSIQGASTSTEETATSTPEKDSTEQATSITEGGDEEEEGVATSSPEDSEDPEQATTTSQAERPSLFSRLFTTVFAQTSDAEEDTAATSDGVDEATSAGLTQESQEQEEKIATTSSETNIVEQPEENQGTTTASNGSEEEQSLIADEEIAKEQDDMIAVYYTFDDGTTWELLALVDEDDWRNNVFPLPLLTWRDLASLQVRLENISKHSDDVIYLDGITVEVEYEDAPIAAEETLEEERLRDLPVVPVTTLERVDVRKNFGPEDNIELEFRLPSIATTTEQEQIATSTEESSMQATSTSPETETSTTTDSVQGASTSTEETATSTPEEDPTVQDTSTHSNTSGQASSLQEASGQAAQDISTSTPQEKAQDTSTTEDSEEMQAATSSSETADDVKTSTTTDSTATTTGE